MADKDEAVQGIKRRFPNLNVETTTITSPSTSKYNCIAYAAGDQQRKWWPDIANIGYWPPGCLRLPTLPVFQMAFNTLGYEVCADGALEDGFEKVAIFHQNNAPTHAAKQLPDGAWSSKLGDWFDISHGPDCLCGHDVDAYGEIAFFMRRQKE